MGHNEIGSRWSERSPEVTPGLHPKQAAGRRTLVGMTRDELLDRIVIDPQVAFGKPVIRGTRIWAGLILGLLADGMTHQEVLAEYPHLTEDDLRACLAYGSLLATGRFIDVA